MRCSVPSPFVAVAGNIGAGKTELVQFLSRRYALSPAFEPHEQNPYLEAFYADMRAWAFHSQLSFLALKLRLHRQLQLAPYSVIQDRTVYEDAEIFERQLHRQRLIDDRDHATYRALYEAASEGLRPPDLMIFLRCPVRTLLKRIARRGRSMERAVPPAYLAALDVAIDATLAQGCGAVVVSLGVDTFALDPISKFKLASADYLAIGARLRRLGVPVLFVFEGGYATDEVGLNAVNVLVGFDRG